MMVDNDAAAFDTDMARCRATTAVHSNGLIPKLRDRSGAVTSRLDCSRGVYFWNGACEVHSCRLKLRDAWVLQHSLMWVTSNEVTVVRDDKPNNNGAFMYTERCVKQDDCHCQCDAPCAGTARSNS